MTIAIIDNFDSFTFNLYQMVQVLTEDKVLVFRNNAISFDELVALAPTHVILSPGPGNPANAGDFGVCAEVILRQSELKSSILGVCLGHQGIAHYLGGKVVQAPEIVHGKASKIRLISPSKLFQGLEDGFEAMRYHSLVASDEALPTELRVLAREDKHNLIMALEHRTRPIFGVQFHPESIGTPEGQKILKNFVELCHKPC